MSTTSPQALRVVSLLPSASEIICALGAGASLVGRSHECDYPADVVATLPVCTRARFADGTSREIDERVMNLLSQSLSLYDVDLEVLGRLRPDLIVTQDQCAVCAASLADVEQALAELANHTVTVLSLSPSTLGDVFGDIRRTGEALGIGARAKEFTLELSERLTVIGEQTGAIDRPTVACLEWIDPLMTAGNWTPELVKLAGGESQLAQTGTHSPRTRFEDLLACDPEVIVVTACGFDLARTRRELAPLLEHADWPELCAVRNARVYLTDGNAYFNRSGPRLVDSTEILAEILHPELFHFGYENHGWAKL